SIERETITRRQRAAWGAVIVGAVLVVGTLPADAALTREACLAKKLAAWGTYQKCQATERAKAVRALPDKPTPQNPERCKTARLAKLFRPTTRAEKAAIACRFLVNSGGTVTDFDTGLEWEQKTADGSVHDKGATFSWSAGGNHFNAPDGTAFTGFL